MRSIGTGTPRLGDGTIVLHNPTDGTNRVNNTGPAIAQLARQVVTQAKPSAARV